MHAILALLGFSALILVWWGLVALAWEPIVPKEKPKPKPTTEDLLRKLYNLRDDEALPKVSWKPLLWFAVIGFTLGLVVRAIVL